MISNSKTLVERTLQFDSPQRIPRHAWSLPWAEEHNAESLRQLRKRFPDDIQAVPRMYLKPTEAVGDRYSRGTYIDDWGTQSSLIISPKIFHQIFKPMYRDYVEIARQFGKYVFLHTDGYVMDVFSDFIEIGIDAINSQIFCMGVKELGKRFRGKITFWGEIDRQYLLPNGTQKEITQAVHEVRDALYEKGGVIAQCEFGLKAKPENVRKVFETWDSFHF